MSTWGAVRAGAVVIGADGYEWEVTGRDTDGTVTMSREGRAPVTGRPAPGAPVAIVSQPAAPAVVPAVDIGTPGGTRAAVATLRETLGPVEVIECGWCTSGEQSSDDDCVCEQHCGTAHCVNFRRALAA